MKFLRETKLCALCYIVKIYFSLHCFVTVDAFARQRMSILRCRQNQQSVAHKPTSLFMGIVRFTGDSTSEIFVPFPENSKSSLTLSKWISTVSESNQLILGTPDTVLRRDGLWDCHFAPVEWFGFDLTPIFVNKIDRDSKVEKLKVSIVDARTEINGSSSGIIGSIMKQANFNGGNVLVWNKVSNRKGWKLSADLSLTLSIPLPPLLPLPPGFNRIGSTIVQRTCENRVENNLRDIRDAYVTWSKSSH
mmetsp:Transcript_20327/g.24907  ORF Transcript_20327/g.24907 Transcript_20327/m.24907 type:complete len:248 (+) Transcript_20327:55-798(+)